MEAFPLLHGHTLGLLDAGGGLSKGNGEALLYKVLSIGSSSTILHEVDSYQQPTIAVRRATSGQECLLIGGNVVPGTSQSCDTQLDGIMPLLVKANQVLLTVGKLEYLNVRNGAKILQEP